jgi:hypothetical protein
MTALKWITTEAKKIRRKFPKRFSKWTDYVKQASAIYATKHGGRSPVGKKRKIGSVRKKSRKVAVSRVKKLHRKEGKAIRALGSIATTKNHLKRQLQERLSWGMLQQYTAKTKTAKRKIGKKLSDYKRQLKNLE